MKTERLRAALAAHLRELGSVLVCFSGGVDSSYLLAEAVETLGRDRALAFTALSPSLDPEEASATHVLAGVIGAEHIALSTHELDDARYRSNPIDRCYFCKIEVYGAATRLARARGIAQVLDGFNEDDRRDHRPGRAAAKELGVSSPLDALGFDKAAIRAAARAIGLPVWDKPALACLASRFPYGVDITEERLQRVARAERALREMGFRVIRVRSFEERASVELGADELPRLSDATCRAAVERAVAEAGFARVEIDPEGYRRGAMNERRRLPVVG
jgi:uncharacterized protein